MQLWNEKHKERFKELLQSDNTNREDVERRSSEFDTLNT